jgi:hypothetical protein
MTKDTLPEGFGTKRGDLDAFLLRLTVYRQMNKQEF